MSPRDTGLPADFYEGAAPEDLARALLRPLVRPEGNPPDDADGSDTERPQEPRRDGLTIRKSER